MASLSLSPKDREAVEAFRRDVIDASSNKVVVVRFTATWCGPCKQLAPILDKVISSYNGRVVEVPVDIDENRLLAEQFRIQSVPTVYAFVRGQPVDGFVGVRPESEIRAMIDKLLTELPPSAEEFDLEARVADAVALFDEGRMEEAANAFAELVQEAPDRPDIVAHYARALIALGNTDGAAQALAALPDTVKDPLLDQARAALDLARDAAPPGALAELKARVDANPADHEARIAYADALFAAGKRDEGADQLFASIMADRTWNEGAARKKLLKHIESIGLENPWSAVQRQRLSTILFA